MHGVSLATDDFLHMLADPVKAVSTSFTFLILFFSQGIDYPNDYYCTTESLAAYEEQLHHTWAPISKPLQEFIATAQPSDYLAQGIRTVAFAKLTNRFFGFLDNFLLGTKPSLKTVIHTVKELPQPELLVLSAEGFELKIAHDIAQATQHAKQMCAMGPITSLPPKVPVLDKVMLQKMQ